MTTYTQENLITAAKSTTATIEGCAFPVVRHTYKQFVTYSEQPVDLYPTIIDFIEKTPHIKKQQRFRSRGFKVLHFTRGLTNLRTHINKPQASKENRSLAEQYLDGDRNIFVLHVQGDGGSLYYVLEYVIDDAATDEPLVNYAN